ncbi:hypothetical protein DFH28DRAFT_1125475 [Melampsora americana]|nr:hypothetical protein DFH28DRAFT_1126018 [Melampsora americana]KAH9816060.1 hypothetical protein DFH28DRAFT_1125475 [Melampsora americana]
MRPSALNLKNCRVKKVFTNESFASSSERSSLELESGGLSPARLHIDVDSRQSPGNPGNLVEVSVREPF